MRIESTLKLLGVAILPLALGALLPLQATAGCGCDHPPPSWSVVLPPFGSPGKTITVFAAGDEVFTPGATYQVSFGSPKVSVVADVSDRIEVSVPDQVNLGPVEIEVKGPGYEHKYAKSEFTALPHPRAVTEQFGMFGIKDYHAAIGQDGTLYVPLDLSDVRDPMQFALAVELPLRFGQDDVVIYNADGVDLTLFTLTVEDPTERQWGSYYGWEVEQDGGLEGVVFEGKTDYAIHDDMSDVFTYWRHEFHTYANAHAPGGSHETDAQGFHPDGTRHVDHYQLVIAIHGLEDGSPLGPGERQMGVGWLSLESDNPVEPTGLSDLAAMTMQWAVPQLHARPLDDGDDDD